MLQEVRKNPKARMPVEHVKSNTRSERAESVERVRSILTDVALGSHGMVRVETQRLPMSPRRPLFGSQVRITWLKRGRE
jgi:hypothetical protein